jgi:uncharacterized damage-inducible protein DinB
MKDHFIRMFEYDRYANHIILDTIGKVNNPDKPVKLMAHLLAARQVWLKRCQGVPAIVGALWPDWPAETLAGIIDANSNQWIEFLQGLQPADLEKFITSKTSRGDTFQDKMIDVLGHVINHGTHHRAQAGQHLIAAGIETLPNTDYIFYIRALSYRQ